MAYEFEPTEHKKELDRRYDNYTNGAGETCTREEIVGLVGKFLLKNKRNRRHYSIAE
jgi:hypothetical protein